MQIVKSSKVRTWSISTWQFWLGMVSLSMKGKG